jgi:hypothetical protein
MLAFEKDKKQKLMLFFSQTKAPFYIFTPCLEFLLYNCSIPGDLH